MLNRPYVAETVHVLHVLFMRSVLRPVMDCFLVSDVGSEWICPLQAKLKDEERERLKAQEQLGTVQHELDEALEAYVLWARSARHACKDGSRRRSTKIACRGEICF
jgi:hypothetical protein